MSHPVRLSLPEATNLIIAICLKAGCGPEMARSLALALVAAQAHGATSLGLVQLPDYLDSIAAGRINPNAIAQVSFPAPAIIRVDADGGIAQQGFDQVFDELCQRARQFGVAIFSGSNSYTTGELGYSPRRLAEAGLVAFGATNGPALMTVAGGSRPVYCTNPLAFAAPRAEGGPLVIDQASSATAFSKIRQAAQNDQTIPAGWAIDGNGHPTTNPQQAIKGALLAFGGERGANIALMVEVLAAGMTGANWSLDAPGFRSGNQCPGAGLFIIALTPDVIDPDFASRLTTQTARLEAEGIHIPGPKKHARFKQVQQHGIEISAALYERLTQLS